VRGDEARLLQIMGNVLTNAVAFTPASGEVKVSLQRLPGAVKVEVKDNGEGIGKEFLPHVFEPFRQEDASLTRARGGLGLGLAVARQIVTLHGGSIRAESAGRGTGASIVIELPLAIES
jgi:signal transduction histidine kinase